MVMDITHRKLMEQKLLEQKEKAEQSDKLKTAFLANISHEIRTPLNGIIGFADILIQQEISESDKEQYSNLIHNLSGQLLSIVNDILEISRIETNQVKLSIAPVNINHILLKLYASFENQARDKHLVFELDSELTENQDVIYGDSTRLVQILTHLLNNAFKFTYSGSIQLGCRLNNEKLIFSVKDTGIGILPENKEIIFERFRQVEDTLTRKFGGSGLGLSISKALVEMMGGEISVDCDSAKGSTFYFTIPYMNVPLKNKVQRNYIETKSCLRDTRILICEDDDFGYLYVNRLLTQAGATTFRAISGTRAIKFCQSEEVIDLIIMDLRMPEMSGNDAAGFIKKLRPSIPIIVSTASSSYEIESLLDKRLFDGVVYKPIISANLLETVCSLL
jgi:nitrogen-specific signal transduction histidine kinase/CheY-like chemotaxis protein